MVKEENKFHYGIKAKLVSAVAMLMVAVIMLVTSTYAWFTLSTAPEVTGISTAVGANGALEMLLLTKDEGGKWVYNEGILEADKDPNTYWGNIVDLSKGYGLDQITLYPSTLNAVNGILQTAMLNTPEYGSDGRVSKVDANTVTGTYDGTDKVFNVNDGYGVRGVGTSSGMTDRQLAYRNALSYASTGMSQARNAAAASLQTYGAALADIAIKHGLNSDATHTVAELTALYNLTEALLNKNGAFDYIETAYENFIVAYAASEAVTTALTTGLTKDTEEYNTALATAELVYKTVQSELASAGSAYNYLNGKAADGTTAATYTTASYLNASGIKAYVDALQETKNNVTSAQTKLKSLIDENRADNPGYAWTDFSGVIGYLVNSSAIKVNNLTVAEIREDTQKLVDAYMKDGGLTVTMPTGGGVYADIADHCGNYDAGIRLTEITYGTMTLTNIPATMNTATTQPTPYLTVTQESVKAAGTPASSNTEAKPITEFYGYIIDLGFKTNAAESNLLLQTTPTDRIYSDNTENEDTWGHGSSMTFKSAAAGFSNDQIEDLMECIRIVFFDTDSNAILAYAQLDVDNATVGADGVTANMYLVEQEVAYTFTYKVDGSENESTVTTYAKVTTNTVEVTENVVNGNDAGTETTVATADGVTTVTVVTIEYTYDGDGNPTAKKTTTTTYVPYDDYALTDEYDGSTWDDVTGVKETTKTTFITKTTDAVITALTQNTAENVSCLVYLDGATITNASVASTATGAASMTGSMNLQFSSSATLVPMEYAEYHNASESSDENIDENSTGYNVPEIEEAVANITKRDDVA